MNCKFSKDRKVVLISTLYVGEEYQIRKDLRVKAFKTYHVIPSQVRLYIFVMYNGLLIKLGSIPVRLI